MTEADYPALYRAADSAAAGSQRSYLRSLRFEYLFLFLGALFGFDLLSSRPYYIAYAVVFAVPLLIMWGRAYLKPEQRWYKARAVTESVKTVTWRYMMRAAPFEGDGKVADARLRDRIGEIIKDSRHIVSTMALVSDGEQVTAEMRRVRGLPLAERFEIYKIERIDDQRNWYVRKAGRNREDARVWLFAATAAYVACILLVLLRVAEPTWSLVKPDPMVVIAASIVGWVQIKRFGELASSYTLTAHEIGLIKGGYASVDDEAALSEFVSEAELAFSREHTQWVARR